MVEQAPLFSKGWDRWPLPVTYRSENLPFFQCDTSLEIRHTRENYMGFIHLSQGTIDRTTRTETVKPRSQRATPVSKEPGLLKNISHLGPLFCCLPSCGSTAAPTAKLAASIISGLPLPGRGPGLFQTMLYVPAGGRVRLKLGLLWGSLSLL